MPVQEQKASGASFFSDLRKQGRISSAIPMTGAEDVQVPESSVELIKEGIKAEIPQA